MAKLSQIKTDTDKAEKGVWQHYALDIQLCIASINNTAYKRERSRVLKPYLRRIRSGSMSSEDILEVLKPAVARYLLLDWKNIDDENGQPITYSPEKALELFGDASLSDLYDFVLEVAGETELYRKELLEQAAKN
jgi:hypothetical protein